MLERGRHLPSIDSAPRASLRPDLGRVHAVALRPLWLATCVQAALLIIVAIVGGWAVGALGAVVLAGGPALLQLVLATLGSAPSRSRVCMVLATSASGFLALATVGGLFGLEHLDGPGGDGVAFQLVCFTLAALHLGVARPCWSRANAAADAARASIALFDEL